jgi:hypothetical protein
MQSDEALKGIRVTPNVVNRIRRGSLQARQAGVEPRRATVNRLLNLRPLINRNARLDFDERHDDKRSNGRPEGIVGTGRRCIDVHGLRVFRTAPRAIGPLISEQIFHAALDRGG